MTNLITRKGEKMQLDGNILTGNTFGIKSYIKTYLDGKWIADRKAWQIDPAKIKDGNSIGLRIDDSATTTAPRPWTAAHFARSADDPNSDY